MAAPAPATLARTRLTDQFGQLFWQYEDRDPVEDNQKRASVTDALNVIRYIRSLPSSTDLVIDAGAHVGAVTVALAQGPARKGRVVAIEADPSNACRVLEHAALNGVEDRVTVLNLALWDAPGVTTLTRFAGANGWQTLGHDEFKTQRKTTSFLPVQTASLTQILALVGADRVGLLKLDIEGAEATLLREARDLLARHRIDRLIVEVSAVTSASFGEDPTELFEVFAGTGYRLFRLAEDGTPAPLHLGDLPPHFDAIAIAPGVPLSPA